MNSRTVGEMFQTRRDLLKLGGLGLLGASVDSVWPLKMAAAEGKGCLGFAGAVGTYVPRRENLGVAMGANLTN